MNDESQGRCLELDEILVAAAREASDPARAHLESCPRCWARLVSHREFVSPPPAADGARLDEARSTISAVLAREIGEAPGARIVAFPKAARRRGGDGRWLAAAAALIMVGALALLVARPPLFGERPTVLRGEGASGAIGAPAVPLIDPVTRPGSVALQWHAVPGAERYRVTFLGADLAVLATLEAGADTTLTLVPGRLPATLASGTFTRYEVEALAGGVTIASSGVSRVRLP